MEKNPGCEMHICGQGEREGHVEGGAVERRDGLKDKACGRKFMLSRARGGEAKGQCVAEGNGRAENPESHETFV